MESCVFICLLIFVTSFSFVIVAGNSASSLKQVQPLCHDHDKLALLGLEQSFLVDCELAYDPASAYPKLKSWKSEGENGVGDDCCTWDGVNCDKETGHVIGLDLSSSCLYGSFPSNNTLFGLDHLLELNLADNDFNFSQIPSSIGHLHKLTSLNLSQSFFSGQVPSDISRLSRLSLLDLSNNGDPLGRVQFNLKLDGSTLDKLVRNLTSLSQLNLAYVDISSVVPVILSNLTSLKAINLHGCNLYGEVPRSIFRLQKLEEVDLSYNRNLGGYLPEFQSNSRLRKIYLSSTSFFGEVPTSIGNLGCLEELSLWSCDFFGSIPSSVGNLTKLTSLALGDNSFGGDLPSSITNLTELTGLCLSNLNVNPVKLTSWLLNLKSLNILALTHVNLRGEIPSFLANLTSLTYLDLSSNQLKGPLPHWLSNLTQLTTLNLGYNQLQGPVPQWFSQLTNLHVLQLSFSDAVVEFDTFLKLQNLRALILSGVSLTFSPNPSTNYSLPKFSILELDFCNLTEFPQFLHNQDELQFLSVSGNNIKGNIPQWVVNKTSESLLSLNLSRNFLTGFEQSSRFFPWSNLQVLDVSGNQFQGLLPSPPNFMQIYQASDNQFFGVIPKQLCKASSLIYLDLSNNNLSGQIPDCIGPVLSSSLLVLNLRGNNFQGTIPQRFSRFCKLKMINLSNNLLEGKLPKSLGSCTMLEILDIGRNRLNDTFPSWLGGLPKLQVLVLRHNKFHGTITTHESNDDFHSLRIIDLSNNLHTGDIPSKYLQKWQAMRDSNVNESDSSSSTIDLYFMIAGNYYINNEMYDYTITITDKGRETYYSKIMTVFRVVDFSGNNFTGNIPDFIGDLRGLQALNLSNNNLHGMIPSSLARIRYLESLDLSRNMLTGLIPQELTQLTFLEVFNVSNNQLMGPIPQGQQFNTFDNSSFDANLALCGYPLSNKCGSPPPHKKLNNDETDAEVHDSMLIDWIIRSCGYLSGLIIGFIIGKIFITDRYHEWFMMTFGRKKSNTRARRASRNRWS